VGTEGCRRELRLRNALAGTPPSPHQPTDQRWGSASLVRGLCGVAALDTVDSPEDFDRHGAEECGFADVRRGAVDE